MSTFGPDYVPSLDEVRLRKQTDTIRDLMLSAAACKSWLTLKELEMLSHYPQASISAQLRHLRKKAFGSYIIEKRRRGKGKEGLWEYQLSRPKNIQERLF